MEHHYVGVDVGGTKIAYGLFDHEKKLLNVYKTFIERDCTCEQFIGQITGDIGVLLARGGGAPEKVKGIGIGVPSNMDFERGYILSTSNLSNLRDFDLRGILGEKFPGAQIVVDNDTNLAVIAEHCHGAARSYRNVVYTTFSTGLGSAFIFDGKIFRGTFGGAGESGHMLITPDEGVLCGCGNRGCLMSYASGSMICKHIAQAVRSGEKTIMTEMAGGNVDAIDTRILYAAYKAGDSMAARMLDQMGRYFGIYLYNLYVALDIPVNVLGGGLLNLGGDLLNRVVETFDRYNRNAARRVQFVKAQLSDRSGIIGAVELLN